jgi:hypothetical protein
MKREDAYAATAEVYAAWGYEEKLGWTPALVGRPSSVWQLTIPTSGIPQHTRDFALQVLDRLGVLEPYDGPGGLHPKVT